MLRPLAQTKKKGQQLGRSKPMQVKGSTSINFYGKLAREEDEEQNENHDKSQLAPSMGTNKGDYLKTSKAGAFLNNFKLRVSI